jgi:hypothetical protein
MLDFEQLAFIEKWRQKASRGIVVVLDGTRGDIIVTLRVGEGAARLNLRGQDATGAVRKQRLAIGDRITMAIEYAAKDVKRGGADVGTTSATIEPGATVSGTVRETGEIVAIDHSGATILVRGETLPGVNEGDEIGFTVASEGKAYFIPTRG